MPPSNPLDDSAVLRKTNSPNIPETLRTFIRSFSPRETEPGIQHLLTVSQSNISLPSHGAYIIEFWATRRLTGGIIGVVSFSFSSSLRVLI